jgi:imidazole glycerol phosphate synthase subunit HisF
VSAAAASSMFQFTEQTPNDVKFFLNSKNIKIRKNVKIQ